MDESMIRMTGCCETREERPGDGEEAQETLVAYHEAGHALDLEH